MIQPPDEKRAEGLRFARRMHVPRAAGLGFGFFCVAAPLWQNDAPWSIWALLFAHAFGWPHFAYAISKRARDPYRAERRNLVADSVMGGVWVVLMQFNLLPSVLLVTALAMDKLWVGGVRFLGKTLAAMLAGGIVTALIAGVVVRPEPTMLTVLACIPFMVTYPLAIGYLTYNLTRLVRQQNRQLAKVSRIDGLSQLANRGAWEDAVVIEYERFKRSAQPATLLMIDIDHFKTVNDRFGHAVGDDVIRSMGDVLRRCLRKVDLAGRYGGEEFGVILPDSSEDHARVIAERIRQSVASTVMEKKHGVRCTVSIGVAALDRDTLGYQAWMDNADRALYAAKRAGRDRTEIYRTMAVEA